MPSLRRLAKLREAMTALMGYAVIAMIFLLPLLKSWHTDILSEEGLLAVRGQGDAYNFFWTYWWFQKAWVLNLPLFHTDWVLPPHGAPLFFHTHFLVPTILSAPLSKVWGIVAAYNFTVACLLTLGAWVYYIFLRATFAVSRMAAFLAGVAFGLSPYFVVKAHAHLNLIGAAFWAGALGILVNSYVQSKFTRVRGLLMAFLTLLVFWNSLLEFFMLVVVSLATVISFELLNPDGPLRRREWRKIFKTGMPFVWTGAIVGTALYFIHPDFASVATPMARSPVLIQLFNFPKLSLLAAIHSANHTEFWGNTLGWANVALVVVALRYAPKIPRRCTLIVLTVICLALTCNTLYFPGLLLHGLPLAGGFRAFSRFMPFLLFFMCIFVAYGIDHWALIRSKRNRRAFGLIVVLLALLEIYPAHLNHSPVAQLPGFDPAIAQLDPARRVLIIPRKEYQNFHDTYQVALNHPTVELSFLARNAHHEREWREVTYPHVYGTQARSYVKDLVISARPSWFATAPAGWNELRELKVGYLLFENPAEFFATNRNWRVVYQNPNAILVEVPL